MAAHVVRVRAGLAAGTAIDRIRAVPLAARPVPTARLMRRMVLWGDPLLPRRAGPGTGPAPGATDLQDTYGRLAWRWRAPRRTRALYRLGELAPAARRSAAARARGRGPPPRCPPHPRAPHPDGAPAPGRTRTRAPGRTRTQNRTRARTA